MGRTVYRYRFGSDGVEVVNDNGELSSVNAIFLFERDDEDVDYPMVLKVRVNIKDIEALRKMLGKDYIPKVVKCDPVSGLVWIDDKPFPLTHIDNLKLLKAIIELKR